MIYLPMQVRHGEQGWTYELYYTLVVFFITRLVLPGTECVGVDDPRRPFKCDVPIMYAIVSADLCLLLVDIWKYSIRPWLFGGGGRGPMPVFGRARLPVPWWFWPCDMEALCLLFLYEASMFLAIVEWEIMELPGNARGFRFPIQNAEAIFQVQLFINFLLVRVMLACAVAIPALAVLIVALAMGWW